MFITDEYTYNNYVQLGQYLVKAQNMFFWRIILLK